MSHEYYFVRRRGYIVSVRCHHCNKEWDIQYGWIILFLVLRAVLPALYILVYLLVPVQFPNHIWSLTCTLLVVLGARYAPAYIFCKYVQCTGGYEKIMIMD